MAIIFSGGIFAILVTLHTLQHNLHSVGGQSLTKAYCPADKRMQVFCYFALWYPETFPSYFSKVLENEIDPYLCSHIVLAYFEFEITAGTNVVFTPNAQREALAKAIIQGGQAKRSTQYVLAVGGYSDFNHDEYSRIARSPSLTENFVNSVVTLLRNHNAQGVDFVWNFIGRRGYDDSGRKYEDLTLLVSITKALCGRMKTKGFICMITLIKVETRDLMSNENYSKLITTIIREADFVNIWTTDINPPPAGPGKFFLVPRDLLLPTYPPQSRSYYDGYSDHSINFVVDFYKQAFKNNLELLKKLSLVISLDFGTFGIKRGENVSITSHAAIHNDENPIQQPRRYNFPYFEICENLLTDTTRWKVTEFPGGVPVVIDYGSDATSTNIAAIPTLNEDYAKKKVAFARNQNLGGISIFHITADDMFGGCRNQTYPILNAINDELNGCRFF